MKPLFFSLANKGGIVCGSDTDQSIFPLSKKEPVVIAFSPKSPIPWVEIVTAYRRQGEPQHHDKFQDYARDFECYVQTLEARPEWSVVDKTDASLFFLGYGAQDIYPSMCMFTVTVDAASNRIQFGDATEVGIARHTPVWKVANGDFERVSVLLRGMSAPMADFLATQAEPLFVAYAERVLEKFAGTKYEQAVKERLDSVDKTKWARRCVNSCKKRLRKHLEDGLDCFSIEELADAVETLIDANLRLTHLQSGGQGLVGYTRELAVITRVEGLTWLKHSLFAI